MQVLCCLREQDITGQVASEIITLCVCFYISAKIKSLWKSHGRQSEYCQLRIWTFPCIDDLGTEP